MASSLTNMLQLVLEAAWRRRQLMLVTSTVIFTIGLAYAIFAPRTYVAKSLLLLQETGSDLPVTRDLAHFGRMQERIAGLRALLKSDLVLYSVMLDVAGPDAPSKPQNIAAWIRDFSSALSLELVGSDFLEFQLKGSTQKGLGKQLEAVTSRFLEALLSTSDAINATQVLLDRRKEELEVAERAYEQFKARMAERLPPTYHADMAQLMEQSKRLQELTWELSAATSELDRTRNANGTATTQPRLLLDPSKISDKSHVAGSGAAIGPVDGSGTSGSSAPSRQSIQARAESRVAALQLEVDKVGKVVNSLQRAVASYAPMTLQLKSLEASVQKARLDHEAYARRFSQPASSVRAQGLLRAPERIKLIDAPRDPEFPTNSRTKIALAALVLSLALAAALAFLAEMIDDTLRRNEEFESITGVPVIARLPRG